MIIVILQTFFGLAVMVIYIGWLIYFFRVYEQKVRNWFGKYFNVTITQSSRGHWEVKSEGNWLRNLGIEFLQVPVLLFYVFVPFASLMTLFFLLMSLIY